RGRSSRGKRRKAIKFRLAMLLPKSRPTRRRWNGNRLRTERSPKFTWKREARLKSANGSPSSARKAKPRPRKRRRCLRKNRKQKKKSRQRKKPRNPKNQKRNKPKQKSLHRLKQKKRRMPRR